MTTRSRGPAWGWCLRALRTLHHHPQADAATPLGGTWPSWGVGGNRLKALEDENARQNKLLAEALLDNSSGSATSASTRRCPHRCPRPGTSWPSGWTITTMRGPIVASAASLPRSRHQVLLASYCDRYPGRDDGSGLGHAGEHGLFQQFVTHPTV